MSLRKLIPIFILSCLPSLAQSVNGIPSQNVNVFNKNVIYASAGNTNLGVAACALNTNINSGGGTADDSCLQADLDALGTAGGGTLYINGYALLTCSKFGTTNTVDGNTQTTALQTHSNVKIDATGGGVFLQANSNWPNQSVYENNGPSTNFSVLGFWFGGFNGLTFNNVTIRNSEAFSALLSNGTNFVAQNVTTTWDTLCTTTCHHDGMHLWGTLSNLYISNYTNVNGDDDSLPFNTDEGVGSYATATAYLYQRAPWSGGGISNVTYDTVNLINDDGQVRWYGITAPGGVATLSNITLRNLHGAPLSLGMNNSGITASSSISISDWWLTGTFGSITIPTSTVATISSTSAVTAGVNGSTSYSINEPGSTVVQSNATQTQTFSSNATSGLVYRSELAGNLINANEFQNIIGLSTSQAFSYGWFKTASGTGMAYLTTPGNAYAVDLGGLFVGTTAPVAVQNGAGVSTPGFTCNTGIQFCVEPSSNTTAPFEVSTSGALLSSTRTGTFVCTSGGSITVANTNAVTASSIIITTNTPGGTQTYLPNRTGGTSGTNFIVTCATADTSTYNYDILN